MFSRDQIAYSEMNFEKTQRKQKRKNCLQKGERDRQTYFFLTAISRVGL